MRKQMKKAISFLLAVTLLAGNSYVDMGVNGAATVTMSDWVEVEPEEDVSDVSTAKEPDSWVNTLQDTYSNVTDFLEKKVRSAFAANEVSEWRYVLDMTGTKVEDGATAIMEKSEVTVVLDRLNIKGEGDMSVVTGVTFTSDRPEVINVSSAGAVTAKLRAGKPGWAMIRAEITESHPKEDGTFEVKKTSYSAAFLVRAELDRTDAEWINVGQKDKVLILDMTEDDLRNKGYQLKFYNLPANENSTCVKFTEPEDPGIVTVDSNGLLKLEGAGHTKLTINNFANVTIEDPNNPTETVVETYTIDVIVLPSGAYGTQNKEDFAKTVNVTIPGDEEFILHTNANPASRLTWEVYTVKQDGTLGQKIEPTGNALMNYTYEAGNIKFSNVKAGTYKVKAYATTAFEESDSLPCLTFNVVVELNLSPNTVYTYLNVGDTFNINENSNIPEGMFGKLFDIIPDPISETIASANRETGVVTAHTYGNQKFSVTYKPSSEYGIYSAATGAALKANPFVYEFEVIDTLSLNVSSLVMYSGGTYQLKVNQTRPGTVTWALKNPATDSKYITVDANGKVTAHAETPKNYEAKVIVYQIVDGVKKMAECRITVQQSVADIQLSPSEVLIGIGEVKSIEAIITPSGLADVNLTWTSSDTSIFDIEAVNGPTSAQIIGKAGGKAILTAINDKNVVVGYCTVTVKQPAEKLELSDTSVEGYPKKSYQLYANILPQNATNKEVKWSSTNTNVVKVDGNGKLTFGKAGEAVIIVQSLDNTDLVAYCNVTVFQSVGGVELDEHMIEMYTGESKRLTYYVSPSNASKPSVEWRSFDTSIVAVDGEGKLTAKGPGTTQVMVMSLDDPSCYDLCTVTVKQQATGVKVNYSTVTMNVGEYFDMEVTITPVNSTEVSLIWESLDPKVVTVSSNGRLTGRSVGEAIVLVRTLNGVSSYCKVTVLEPVDDMEVDPGEVTIDVGEVFKLEPVFKPAKPSNVSVKWTSSDNNIVKVNVLGEIEGITKGTAVIICESVDGGYRSFCLVTVEDPDMVVTINPSTYRLGINKSYTLEAVVTSGKGTKDVDIEWSSSDPDVCTVDQNGKITGLDYGYATIRAEVEDGYGAYAECEVRVVREVTSVKLNHNYLEIIQGKTASLKATIQPSNATYLDALFTSSDESIAMVDDDGLVTALKPGTTTIRADAKDNSGKYAICHVTVIAPISATGITVSDKEIVLVPGEKKQITTAMKPNNSTDGMTWSSNNEVIATVNGSGTISAHNTGTATITVMTDSGKIATINVIVLGLSRTEVEMPLYVDNVTLYVDGATSRVRWDVQDRTICEVNNGVITTRKVGTTYVTATINGRTLRCKVTVLPNKK